MAKFARVVNGNAFGLGKPTRYNSRRPMGQFWALLWALALIAIVLLAACGPIVKSPLISDKAISFVEGSLPEKSSVEKTIFSVPYDWVEEGKIKKEHLVKLKKVCEDLGLVPIGYLMTIEAIVHFLQKSEGAPVSAVFIETAQKHESKLYPDTYQIAIKTTSQIIVDKLLANYDQKMAENKINPSAEDLILASIVEREAKFDEDRAKIAGVFKNRLKIGMALEADPTVQYAQENNQKKDFEYWQELAIGDITINSPFNTYKVKGLPPAPICNPSIKSILNFIVCIFVCFDYVR